MLCLRDPPSSSGVRVGVGVAGRGTARAPALFAVIHVEGPRVCVFTARKRSSQVPLNGNAAQGPLHATKPGDATAVKLHGLID